MKNTYFKVSKVERDQTTGKLTVHTDKGTKLDSVDQLIWAVGRDPLIEGYMSLYIIN